uniref:Mitochondrial ribosomal protein L5 n=1 Tax=Parastrongyloides trichosuri TaxID=131310 RepID=A0A0N4Z7W0_PARTI
MISNSFHIKAKVSKVSKVSKHNPYHSYVNKNYFIDTTSYRRMNLQLYSNMENRKKGVIIWRLYNKCSHGFVQNFLRIVNAKGEKDDRCYSEFEINPINIGVITLRHRLTKRYICFNKRKRLTVKNEGHDSKCHFKELITKSGYTKLQSVYHDNTFLGFNRNGKFLDPLQHNVTVHCFYYTKLQRYISYDNINTDHPCTEKTFSLKEQIEEEIWKTEKENMEEYVYNMRRESFLDQIRAT